MDWVQAVDEGGALILLGFVLFWVTQKLNGKLDRLTDAVKVLTDVMREHNESAKR